MKRYAGAAFLGVTLISGCVSGPETGGGPPINYGKSFGPPTVPGIVGPNGTKVPMMAPYDQAGTVSPWQAQKMMTNSVPMDSVQFNRPGMNGPGFAPPGAGVPPTMVPPGGILSPPGMPFAPGVPAGPGIKPVSFLPNGPNPGVVTGNMPPGAMGGMPPGAMGGMPPGAMGGMPPGAMGGMPPGAMGGMNMPPGNIPPGAMAAMAAMNKGPVTPAMYAQFPGGAGAPFTIGRTQVKFTRPTGMKISWFTKGADGKPAFSTTPLETPGRYNFPQAAIYRLKLSNIEGRPGVELYPTLEVVPQNPKTEAFLAHSSVPVEFTNEDLKQVSEGNYIIKVIYLPDPHFQDAAGTGTDEILSTRLEPGADPIHEALRRGSILLVIRMGNVDQEAPNTPSLNTPPPGAGLHHAPHHPPTTGMPNVQVPIYGLPGMRPPQHPSTLPPTNSKDAGKASTGLPGGPINVPSLPLNPPKQPNFVDIAPKTPGLPNVAPPPGLDNNSKILTPPPGLDNNKVIAPPPPSVPFVPQFDIKDVKIPPKDVPPPPVAPEAIKGAKDGAKVMAPATPTSAPTPAKDNAEGKPAPARPAQPGLPELPGFPDLNPGPQSRSDEGQVAPSLAHLAEDMAAPRR